jgi:hypothetical protein
LFNPMFKCNCWMLRANDWCLRANAESLHTKCSWTEYQARSCHHFTATPYLLLGRRAVTSSCEHVMFTLFFQSPPQGTWNKPVLLSSASGVCVCSVYWVARTNRQDSDSLFKYFNTSITCITIVFGKQNCIFLVLRLCAPSWLTTASEYGIVVVD